MKRSDETRQKMRNSWAATKEKRIAAQKAGRTPESSDKVSTALKARWADSVIREKTANALKARFATPESKEKRSKAAKAMWAKRKELDNT